MSPLQVLFISNWQHNPIYFTLTVELHQTRLYLTWPRHEECVYFLLNPGTIVRRLWKKNRICRRGEKWVSLPYKLQLCPWEKGRLSFRGHQHLDHIRVVINRNGADRAASELLLINAVIELDRGKEILSTSQHFIHVTNIFGKCVSLFFTSKFSEGVCKNVQSRMGGPPCDITKGTGTLSWQWRHPQFTLCSYSAILAALLLSPSLQEVRVCRRKLKGSACKTGIKDLKTCTIRVTS